MSQNVLLLLENDSTYNFGELLINPASLDPQLVNTIELFAYGDYAHYAKYKSQYTQLNEKQLVKLIKLTLISLANDFEGYSVDIIRILLENQLESAIKQYLSLRSGSVQDGLLQGDETISDALEQIIIDMKYHGTVDMKIDQAGQKVNIIKALVLRDSYVDETKLRVLTDDDVGNRLTKRAMEGLQQWLDTKIVPLREESKSGPEE